MHPPKIPLKSRGTRLLIRHDEYSTHCEESNCKNRCNIAFLHDPSPLCNWSSELRKSTMLFSLNTPSTSPLNTKSSNSSTHGSFRLLNSWEIKLEEPEESNWKTQSKAILELVLIMKSDICAKLCETKTRKQIGVWQYRDIIVYRDTYPWIDITIHPLNESRCFSSVMLFIDLGNPHTRRSSSHYTNVFFFTMSDYHYKVKNIALIST